MLLGAGGGKSCPQPTEDAVVTDTLPLGLGHLATQIAARAMGLRVIGIDSGNKREVVMDSGAEHFIDFTTSKDVAKEVMGLTSDLGVHAVINLTASNGSYAMQVFPQSPQWYYAIHLTAPLSMTAN